MDFDAMQKIALLLFVSLVMYDESGGGWTRTTERIPGQIYSLLQLPLCDSPKCERTVSSFLRVQKYNFFSFALQKPQKISNFAALKPQKR